MRGLNGKDLVAAIEAELLAEGCLIEVEVEPAAPPPASRPIRERQARQTSDTVTRPLPSGQSSF